MRILLDLRISEDWACKHLGTSVSKPLATGPGIPVVTRQVLLYADDPLTTEIQKKVLTSEARGESFFCFVNQDFIYEDQELNSAELLVLKPTAQMRTYGARYAQIYDDSNACPKCGFGRSQIAPLVLEHRFFKAKNDFFVTITADEWIISERFASLLGQVSKDGYSLHPIFDSRGHQVDGWFQLKVDSILGRAVAPTKFGLDFFHTEDTSQIYVCPQHELAGLNILSEVHIKPNGVWADLSKTTTRVGRKSGWIVPAPFLLASRDLADAIVKNKIRGLSFCVAHLSTA